MFRSASLSDCALTRRLAAGLVAGLLLLTAAAGRAEQHHPKLHSGILEFAEKVPSVGAAITPDWSQTAYTDLTDDGKPEALFYMTFAPGEAFRFIVPISLTWAFQEPIFADGGTRYAYDVARPDGPPLTVTALIPNKILRIRNQLLAAEGYLNAASVRARVPFRLVDANKPIDAYIGHFGAETRASGTLALARFYRQEMRFRQDISDSAIKTTPSHELFHLATHAALLAHAGDAALAWYHAAVRQARDVLFEGLADWFEDEPVEVPAGPGQAGPLNTDTANNYFCYSFLSDNETDLFARNEYCTSLLFKYYTEQVAGGRDVAGIDTVLALLIRVYDTGRLKPDSLAQAMAEGLPAERFPGADWRERWRNFYAAFAAAALVQRASAGDGAGGYLGFHDDAFSGRRSAAGVLTGAHEHKEDYLSAPGRIHGTRAADEDERRRRLAEYAQESSLLTFAYPYHGIILNRPGAEHMPPRSAYVYARGDAGANVFLLRQSVPTRRSWWNRDVGRHERIADFALPADGAADFAEVANLDLRGERQYVWLGLVNSGPPEDLRDMSWAYFVTPRMIPKERGFSGTYENVRVVGGSAHARGFFGQVYNGDDITFEFESTGKLHLGAGTRERIPAGDHNIAFRIHCGDRLATLASIDGTDFRLDAAATAATECLPSFHTYRLTTRIDPENAVTGECKARVEIASLLNMGGADRQVDEAVTFRLGDPRPRVARVQVAAGETVVYDSETNLVRAVEASGGRYALKLTIWFSTLMDYQGAAVTAGFGPPYTAYTLATDPMASDDAMWNNWSDPADPGETKSKLEVPIAVPEGDAPNGGFLWFAISGESYAGVPLDADPARAGAQPDVHHYAMLDLDAYYLATLSMQTRHVGREREAYEDRREEIDYQEAYRPFQAQVRLVPVESYFRDPLFFLDAWARTLREVEGSLAAQREQRDQINAYIDASKAIIANIAEESKPVIEAQLQTLRDQMTSLEAAVAVWEETLALIRPLDADHRALVAFMKGYGEFSCDDELTGPVRARFGGMEGWFHSRFSTPTPVYQVRTEHAAPGWSSQDLRERNWLGARAGSYFCPRLEVLHYTAADFAKVAAIAAGSTPPRLPAYIAVPANMPWIRDSAQAQLDTFARLLAETAEQAVAIAWRFAWSDEGAVRFHDPYREPLFHDGRPRLPALPEGPLMRIRYNLNAGWPFPVNGTGTYWEQRTGEVPYRDDYTFDFFNRRHAEDEDLYAYFNSTWSDGGVSRIHSGTMERPRYLPEDSSFDIEWRLEGGGGNQITSYTHPQHIAYGHRFVITARAPGDELAGGLSVNFQSFDVNGVEQHESRFGWHFARNAMPPGQGEDWPQIGHSGDGVGPVPPVTPTPEPPSDGPEVATGPEDGGPDDDGGGDGEERPEAPPDDDDRPSDDDTTAGGTASAGTGGDDDRLAPPTPVAGGGGAGGIPVPFTTVTPTIQYAGVLTGGVENNSTAHEPGHVVVWLEGEALPEADGQPLLMDLHDGFRQSFVAVPVGGAIRFRNVEAEGGVSYALLNEDEELGIEESLAPGEEVVIEFPAAGRFTILDTMNAEQRLEVVVVESTRFAAFDAPLYIIRDVPPATYVMHVLTESRRYQPIAMEVAVRPTGHTSVDIELVERGGLAGLPSP